MSWFKPSAPWLSRRLSLCPSGFFNFDLDKYKDQLVAGYSRTLPDLGLEVYMLGVDKLATGKATTAELPR